MSAVYTAVGREREFMKLYCISSYVRMLFLNAAATFEDEKVLSVFVQLSGRDGQTVFRAELTKCWHSLVDVL